MIDELAIQRRYNELKILVRELILIIENNTGHFDSSDDTIARAWQHLKQDEEIEES